MATRPVNMVDAVSVAIPRLARARSAVLRFGRVKTAPAAGMVVVTLGSDTKCGYLAGLVLAGGDWVAVLADNDRWLVIGKVAPVTLTELATEAEEH